MVALLSAAASADTFIDGVATAYLQAPWGETFKLKQFDPSLGTLTGVTFFWTAGSYAEVEVKHGAGAGFVLFDNLGANMNWATQTEVINGLVAPATC